MMRVWFAMREEWQKWKEIREGIDGTDFRRRKFKEGKL